MRRFLPIVMLLMTASAANAGGLVHKMSSSVQLTVDSARTTATRLGSQYSVSGSNVNTTDGSDSRNCFCRNNHLWCLCLLVQSPATQATAGEAFSFSSSYLQGDAVSNFCSYCRNCWQLLQSDFLCTAGTSRRPGRYYRN